MNKAKKFIEKLKPLNLDTYLISKSPSRIRDELVTYTISFLEKNNIIPTFPNITAAVFKLFPKSFRLIGFPKYPDGRLVRDALFHITHKSKGWATGKLNTNHSVTKKGICLVIDRLNKKFGETGKQTLSKKLSSASSYKDFTKTEHGVKEIGLLFNSKVFKLYKENKLITRDNIANMFGYSISIPSSVLINKLKKTRENINHIKRSISKKEINEIDAFIKVLFSVLE